MGWFPENHTSDLVFSLFWIKLFQGLILQQAFVSFGSMMADVADEHEYEYGVRQEGIFFGAIAFSNKATSGFGNFLGGLGLDLINWPRGAGIQTADDIPAETLVNLGLLYGPLVGACAVFCLWCYSHYNLTRERHAFILVELRKRRKPEALSKL